MIFGRNSLQWLGLVAVLLQVGKQFVPAGVPTYIGTLLDFLTAVDAALMAWIAQTSTTPTNDPQLKSGTLVRVTDESGTVVDHRAI